MSSKDLTILIIDDDPLDRDVLKRWLCEVSDRKPIIHEAASGQEGIERCASLQPDCILLDYRLPDLDGVEVVRELKSKRAGCAIVMLTAIGNERVAVEAMKAGVLDYASKDTASPEALHHIVRNAVEKYRLQAQVEEQRAAIEQRNQELEKAIRSESLARYEAESSRAEYRVLVETIPQMVWRSTRTGEVTFANERWRNYMGAPVSPCWLDRVHEQERSGLRDRWLAAVETAGHCESEARLLRHDGEYRWHVICAVPAPDWNHGGTCLLTATDITEQREAQRAMLQQQKLDSIGLLAGGVAHDFNNLLVGIMGNASFALDTMASAHPARTLLQNVVEASERAAHLTRQLLAYAGKGQFTAEPIDLSQLVLRTSGLVEAFVPKSVQLKLDLDPHLPALESDPGQIEQVVMNLIINAAEAIGPDRHGFIAVRTSVEEIADRTAPLDAWGTAIPAGRYVVFEVRDTGCGIPEETRMKIFDPFFSTKFTGRGLGLAAVQGIVRSNRGAIHVTSAAGRGTTFRVFLPATGTATRNPVKEQPEAVKGCGTILVIDDELFVRNVAEVALERAGYGVFLAAGGRAGVELIRTHPEITAVLLDMSMPEMSGPEVLAAIREFRPDVPVIVSSGSSESEVRRQFAAFPLAGIIQKPFTTQKLAMRVNELLAPCADSSAAASKD